MDRSSNSPGYGDHAVDLDGLRRLHRNLGSGGLLGRRIERSPLPFGRHRWVRSTGLLDIDVAAAARPVAELNDWINERGRVPVDLSTARRGTWAVQRSKARRGRVARGVAHRR